MLNQRDIEEININEILDIKNIQKNEIRDDIIDFPNLNPNDKLEFTLSTQFCDDSSKIFTKPLFISNSSNIEIWIGANHENGGCYLENISFGLGGSEIITHIDFLDGPIHDLIQFNENTILFNIGPEIHTLDIRNNNMMTNNLRTLDNDISEIKMMNNQFLVAYENKISLIKISDLTEIYIENENNSPITSINFYQDLYFSFTTLDGFINIYNQDTNELVLRKNFRPEFRHGQLFSHEYINENTIVMGGNYRSVFFIDIQKEKVIGFIRDPICQSIGQIIHIENDLYMFTGLGGVTLYEISIGISSLQHNPINYFSTSPNTEKGEEKNLHQGNLILNTNLFGITDSEGILTILRYK